MQLIASGEADFGIGPRPSGTQVTFTRLDRDDFVAAVPQDHPLAGREAISLKELAAYPIITTTRNTNARTVLERAIHELHQTMQPPSSWSTICRSARWSRRVSA